MEPLGAISVSIIEVGGLLKKRAASMEKDSIEAALLLFTHEGLIPPMLDKLLRP